jgi:O-antigen/teichoic acid export membrane protein
LAVSFGFFSLGFGFAIAILRYRLFDIDVIIRRTLQYSLLTGLLSLIYFGGVALLQGILTADRGKLLANGDQPSSAVVIVVTTLVIAALFNPLRRWLQGFIDRRFYRSKYDAEKALAEFAAVARSGNDLAQLSERLTTTVQETLQPQQISLWLKPAATGLRAGSNPPGES